MFRLYIDPGINVTGWALFRGSMLQKAGLARGDSKGIQKLSKYLRAKHVANQVPPDVVDAIRYEHPRIYPNRPKKKSGPDPNDLLVLTAVNGAVAMLHDYCQDQDEIQADVWTGGIPKKVRHNRLRKKLLPREIEIVDNINPKSLAHNALDAVGMGLWHLAEEGIR